MTYLSINNPTGELRGADYNELEDLLRVIVSELETCPLWKIEHLQDEQYMVLDELARRRAQQSYSPGEIR